MEENTNQLIWQILALLLMMSALTTFFVLNNQIRMNFDVINNHITDGRTVIENTSDEIVDNVWGSEIIFMLSHGLEIPIEIEGNNYDLDVFYHHTGIDPNMKYMRYIVVDSSGELVLIRYVRNEE